MGSLNGGMLVAQAIELQQMELKVLEGTSALMASVGAANQRTFRLQIIAAATGPQREILGTIAERIDQLHRKMS